MCEQGGGRRQSDAVDKSPGPMSESARAILISPEKNVPAKLQSTDTSSRQCVGADSSHQQLVLVALQQDP